MRRAFLTTVAAGVLMSPAFAQNLNYGGPPGAGSSFYSGVAGGVELGLGRVFADDEKDFGIFQGAARANIPVGNTWNILLETGGFAAFEDGESESQIGATGHLWANRGNLRYGVYAGVSYNQETFGRIGIEYEYDITNKITVGGQASASFADPDCCDSVKIYNIRGWVDYYFTDNTKLTGQISYINADFDGGSDDAFSYSKRLTHRFDGTPFNIFAHADYTRLDSDLDAFTLLGGVTVLLDGGGTQKTYDQNVAPFDDLGGALLLGINF